MLTQNTVTLLGHMGKLKPGTVPATTKPMLYHGTSQTSQLLSLWSGRDDAVPRLTMEPAYIEYTIS